MNSRLSTRSQIYRLEGPLTGVPLSDSSTMWRIFWFYPRFPVIGLDNMLKCFLSLFFAGLSCGLAWPQQNMDTYVTLGNSSSRAYRIEGTDLTANGSGAFSSTLGFGYRLVRVSSTSIWLDLSQISGSPDDLKASAPGGGKTTWQAYVAGVRLMAPVGKRLAPYALTGVGGGLFHAIGVHGGPSITVSTYRTLHGVFDFWGRRGFPAAAVVQPESRVQRLFDGQPTQRRTGPSAPFANVRHGISLLDLILPRVQKRGTRPRGRSRSPNSCGHSHPDAQ